MLSISYLEPDCRALLRWLPEADAAPWLDILRRQIFDYGDSPVQEGGRSISMPWWSFIAMRPRMLEIFTAHELSPQTGLFIDAGARALLEKAGRNIGSYEAAMNAAAMPPDELASRLSELSFGRALKPEQSRNVGKIALLPAAATFSVPGAGKTTEALAYFFLRAKADERLLVVAPKNAFAAWDEQIAECMPQLGVKFERLRGGREGISRSLSVDPRFMIITYQQLVLDRALVQSHVARFPTHVFLDESHRIKSGLARQTPQAALSLSHLAVSKLIMSGTPMPQSADDLLPQFAFLYPEIPASGERVVELMRPVYVRTNKAELGLPPVDRDLVSFPMAPVQGELYKLMKFEVARDAATALSLGGKQAFRQLGRSVMRLMQFVSNPALLAAEIGFAHENLLRAVLAEGDGPKLRYVLKRARLLARSGQKVLIWSSFRRNVEYIADRLADLGAVYIHGGVDAGDEDDDETREGKIKLFHSDETVMVMVANPAAASEGVSLHTVCHHAIYLDRTFNAAHYLQSEDRIHRVGLAPNQKTTIEIVECEGTIDETIRERLKQKIDAMAKALDDSSLKPDPTPIDPAVIAELRTDFGETGLSESDIASLLRDPKGEGT